jgi:hypothetical protein
LRTLQWPEDLRPDVSREPEFGEALGEFVEGKAKLVVVVIFAVRLVQDARCLEGVVEWYGSGVMELEVLEGRG